ncbi:hypothetical protein USDA257_c39200 [Sinorhizobium fredii USDA 257]|uniref:Restriction endonuclease type IV Mrr domain-containing protein n=2 Tax=Rhizobium fredii TaxID=380 RepID=I3X9A8_SINF2|nr:hypothetical protein USDA257_c39200 [Sinorhizobium fredii USDA 257]
MGSAISSGLGIGHSPFSPSKPFAAHRQPITGRRAAEEELLGSAYEGAGSSEGSDLHAARNLAMSVEIQLDMGEGLSYLSARSPEQRIRRDNPDKGDAGKGKQGGHMSQPSKVAVGTEYEKLARDIYERIIRAEGVETIEVEHNKIVTGKSGCNHQIDVYWEFRIAGKTYRTAIECKAFSSEVSIGRIRDFYGVLVDVNNLSGLFVTKVGFQSGARRFAEHYGITLKELREPTATDWSGRAKDIHLKCHVVQVDIVEFAPRVSQAFLDTLPPEGIGLSGGIMTDEQIVFDASGAPVASLEDLRQRLPSSNETLKGQQHYFKFPGHILRIEGYDLPLDGIDIVYDVNIETEEVISRGEEIVQAIIKDALDGDLTVVHHDGTVKKVPA